MKEILTNEEIDTLLDMFRAEGAEMGEAAPEDFSAVAGADGEGPLVSPVDLLKPNRFGREHLIGFERCFEMAAKGISATTSDKLRFDVACDCVAVEQLRLSAWVQQLGAPSTVYVLKMPPFELPVLFSITNGLLYGAVDRVLGGSGHIGSVPADLTAAEYTVADAFVGPCIDQIVESIDEVVTLTWEIENRYCNPALAQVIAGHDVVLSVYFQASGEHLLGDLRLAIPFNVLEPYLGRVGRGSATGFRDEPGSQRAEVERAIAEVPVDLSVRLGGAFVPLRELMALQVGDVIPLDTKVGDPLVAPVRGVPKFLGHIGTRANRFAFRVGTVLEG